MHTKLLEKTHPTYLHRETATLIATDLQGNKTMYHAINRLLIHIKKELLTHPYAAFYLTLGTTTYTLAVQPDEDVTAHTESLASCLAHILFINWDALRSRATKFYCVTTSDEAESEEVTVNKTLGFFQALGAPALRNHD